MIYCQPIAPRLVAPRQPSCKYPLGWYTQSPLALSLLAPHIYQNTDIKYEPGILNSLYGLNVFHSLFDLALK